ncbi:YeeE/YedE family protein [Yoonia sediminilitoris]|uniref:Sulfur transporter n=1 Tax=Yoonia sediminilitoris TaxID=1286148 RepID=A0A2T6KQT9_9RHOB|nr:YeeE/YedE family protein [Yoonia sediminilitoris]PUB18929.1 sulfur transporter [Yoonia sediminilitoris]RCW99097.1 sulfur transporter [Yoonia sediminilitoris]
MLEQLIETYGEGPVLVAFGGLVGALFGAMAQHSRFCLRAATIELADGQLGNRMAVWLVAFSAAVVCVQSAIWAGWLDVSESRQLASLGSMSGAIIGGLMFGVGMILARGCASRLLVLSATGNLRAIVTGLVLTLVAQSALRGALSPARETLASLWSVQGGAARDLLAQLGLSSGAAALISVGVLCGALAFAYHSHSKFTHIAAAAGVGLAVALGWIATYAVAMNSFEVIAISSITFTGPSTDTLMGLVNSTQLPLVFGVGLVPGVFFGAGGMALATKEAKIQRFEADTPMEYYLIGAALMGFGSMLAGGCAVGAGMSGGAIFALTAWVAVGAMWIGAMITHTIMRQEVQLQKA